MHYRWRAKLEKYGWNSLLVDVECIDDPTMTADHVWVGQLPYDWVGDGVVEGVVYTFYAEVVAYWKGYQGQRQIDEYRPIEQDYKLVGISTHKGYVVQTADGGLMDVDGNEYIDNPPCEYCNRRHNKSYRFCDSRNQRNSPLERTAIKRIAAVWYQEQALGVMHEQ
jgi:hypothetical protein